VTGPYDVSLVVTGTDRMSNVSPPTLLLALQCSWMSCAFVATASAIRRWASRPRVWHVVAVGCFLAAAVAARLSALRSLSRYRSGNHADQI
jgi:hypothetical protein